METRQVFLGSATEHEEIVKDLQRRNSRSHIRFRPWTDLGTFPPSEYPLDSLLNRIAQCDGAALLAFGVDIMKTRNKDVGEPRDNVIFEAGMAYGILGRKRTVMVVDPGTKVPSDLQGLTTIGFDVNKSDANDLHAELESYFTELFNELRSAPTHLSERSPERFPDVRWERLALSFPEVKNEAIKQAIALVGQRKYSEAEKYLSTEDHVIGSYLRARIAVARRKQKEIEATTGELLNRALDLIINDQNYDAYWFFEIASRRLLKVYRQTETIRVASAKLSDHYQPADLYHLRGLVELTDGNYSDALKFYDMAISLGSTNLWTYTDKVECYLKMGEKKEYITQELASVHNRWPDNINVECLFRYLQPDSGDSEADSEG